MQMVPVHSSNLESVGYDSENNLLYVRFRSGDCYVYHGVPERIYSGIINATSPGKFLNENVKDIYPFRRTI